MRNHFKEYIIYLFWGIELKLHQLIDHATSSHRLWSYSRMHDDGDDPTLRRRRRTMLLPSHIGVGRLPGETGTTVADGHKGVRRTRRTA